MKGPQALAHLAAGARRARARNQFLADPSELAHTKWAQTWLAGAGWLAGWRSELGERLPRHVCVPRALLGQATIITVAAAAVEASATVAAAITQANRCEP